MVTTTPTRSPVVAPETAPRPDPERRYEPDPDHCPDQRVRTTRRVRRVFDP